MSDQPTPYTVALLSGGIAGLVVDVSLYPLDTVKTRLQSKDGFMRSGGFRGIYRGLGPVIVGSVPGASVFFCSYELTKKFGSSNLSQKYDPVIQMVAASVSELFACIVRVPVEVVKQRAQASKVSSFNILKTTLHTEGVRGLYRGYYSTIIREVPFSFLQFPLWEFGKKRWSQHQGHSVDAWQSAICGAVSGGVAAFITNPLDLAKTRIMLAERNSETAKGNIRYALMEVVETQGLRGLFAGVLPRVMWISIGGAIFLGAYEKAKIVLTRSGVI